MSARKKPKPPKKNTEATRRVRDSHSFPEPDLPTLVLIASNLMPRLQMDDAKAALRNPLDQLRIWDEQTIPRSFCKPPGCYSIFHAACFEALRRARLLWAAATGELEDRLTNPTDEEVAFAVKHLHLWNNDDVIAQHDAASRQLAHESWAWATKTFNLENDQRAEMPLDEFLPLVVGEKTRPHTRKKHWQRFLDNGGLAAFAVSAEDAAEFDEVDEILWTGSRLGGAKRDLTNPATPATSPAVVPRSHWRMIGLHYRRFERDVGGRKELARPILKTAGGIGGRKAAKARKTPDLFNSRESNALRKSAAKHKRSKNSA